MVISSRYKVDPFLQTQNQKLQRDGELCVLVHCFLTGQNSAVEERPKSIQTQMKKSIVSVKKKNPFLKTAAKQKPPAVLMIWPVKLANMKILYNASFPLAQASPTRFYRIGGGNLSPLGQYPSFQAFWLITHKTAGSQLWPQHFPNNFPTYEF